MAPPLIEIDADHEARFTAPKALASALPQVVSPADIQVASEALLADGAYAAGVRPLTSALA